MALSMSGGKFLFTVEQLELIRRLRNSGLTKQHLLSAFDSFERLDHQLGDIYNIPLSLVAYNFMGLFCYLCICLYASDVYISNQIQCIEIQNLWAVEYLSVIAVHVLLHCKTCSSDLESVAYHICKGPVSFFFNYSFSVRNKKTISSFVDSDM